MLWSLVSLVSAAPVTDAVRLYRGGRHLTCAERATGDHVCWGGPFVSAVPASEAGVEPSRPPCAADGDALVCGEQRHPWPTAIDDVSGTCAVGEGKVHCVGDAWRMNAGMAPGTPTDEPIHVAAFDGAAALTSGGRCILRDGAIACLDFGRLKRVDGMPPLASVRGDCGLTEDHELWCHQHHRAWHMDVGPVADFARGSGRGLIRRPDGTLASWVDRPSEIRTIDLPPSQGGPGTLYVALEHQCAIVDGRIACWGSNWHNQLGDGVGRSLHWVAPRAYEKKLRDRPMRCALEDGTVRCTGKAPWGDTVAPLPPVELHDVERLELSGFLGCAITEAKALHCFGSFDDVRLLPDEPILTDIVDVSVAYGIAALGADGTLYHWVHGENRFEAHGPLSGATRVATNGAVSCALAPDTLLCADLFGEVHVPEPDGTPEQRRGIDICIRDNELCLEGGSALISKAAEPHWVEAGW